MPFTEITELHEFNDIIKSDTYSLIKFVSPWCSSKKKLDRIIEGISDMDDFEDKPIKFYSVNIERFNLPKLGIKTLPVTILFQNGNEISRTLAVDTCSIIDLIDKLFPLFVEKAEAEAEVETVKDKKENVEQHIYTPRGYYSD